MADDTKNLIKAIQEENEKTRGKLERAAALEVASKEEIKELKRIAKGNGEEAKEAEKKLRAELAKTANKEAAQKTLKANEESLKEQKKISGLSVRRIKKADVLSQAIVKQQEIMQGQKDKLDELGIDSSTNKKYQEEELKLAQMQKDQARTTGSADAEDEADKKIADARSNTYLGKIANYMGSMWGSMKDAAKQKGKDAWAMIKKFAFGAAVAGLLLFLQSDTFKNILETIKGPLAKGLTYLYENVIKTLAAFIGGKLLDLWERSID